MRGVLDMVAAVQHQRATQRDPCRAPELLTIEEACTLVSTYVRTIIDMGNVPLSDAINLTLAMDVNATVAIPPFTQSAMDGFAVQAGAGLPVGTYLTLAGRVAAGAKAPKLSTGCAIRLFTGAPLPKGADAVIMQEHVTRQSHGITLTKLVQAGDNVRYRGEDIDPPVTLLAHGTRLDARHIGLLAGQGMSVVSVLRRVRVAVISTGDELRQAGTQLTDACIFDSNRQMLLALIGQAGLDRVDGGWVPDCPTALAHRLRELSETADLIITTGGASVGEEDHAASALALAGGDGQTLKIALKPGKPAVVGRIGTAAYLGLPGNPMSSLVSWLILGRSMIAAMERRKHVRRSGCPMPSLSYFTRRAGRTEFVPARMALSPSGVAVEILGKGGSARLRPLVEADGLAEIEASSDGVNPGDVVQFYPFRDGFAF